MHLYMKNAPVRRLWLLSATFVVLAINGTAYAATSTQSSSSASVATDKVKVTSVVDGDTIKVKLGTKTETIRIIGIDTPETVDPRKPVQCYGKEASARMKKLVNGKTVTLQKNPAEERDKYDRLLRYVFIGSKDIGASMIQDGYAFSYKEFPHPKLDAYNKLETNAKNGNKGLWGDVCNTSTTTVKKSSSSSKSSKSSSAPAVSSSATCSIKGNINSSKEHIYHLPGCASYNQTIIDTSKGEKIFCSEEEARTAGWRKALNCPK